MSSSGNGSKGRNLVDVQQMNRSLLIRALIECKRTTRVKLARESGLHQATITNMIRDFIEWGLVREVKPVEGLNGRRAIELELMHEPYKVICIRLTRKYFSIIVFDIYLKPYFK